MEEIQSLSEELVPYWIGEAPMVFCEPTGVSYEERGKAVSKPYAGGSAVMVGDIPDLEGAGKKVGIEPTPETREPTLGGPWPLVLAVP